MRRRPRRRWRASACRSTPTPGRGSVDRQPPARRDLPRHGRRRQARDHGRADGLADPARGRRAARASSRDLKRAGICIVFVSHRLDEVIEIAERVTVLRDGAKVGTFPAREMDDKQARDADDRQGLRLRTSATTDSAKRRPCLSVAASDARGRVRGRQPSTIRAGEILGLTGLLGSGRTELALSLFGMTRPTSGEIRARRQARSRCRPMREAIDAGIAYVSEDRLDLGLVLEQPIGVEHRRHRARQAGRRARPDARADAPARRRASWIDDLAIKVADPENAGEDALGRQPAARRARQMDGDASPGS